MKKTYLSPKMVMTEVETEQLICQSIFSEPAPNGSYGLMNSRYNYYDEEEEEEEDLW